MTAAAALALSLAASGADGEALVSAAASLRSALAEVVQAYREHDPAADVAINTAASGVLVRQIEHGAPVDLFLSASSVEIDRLEARGLVRARAAFASGELVAVVPAGRSPPRSFELLSAERFERIAIGNPSTVPVGRYARQTLRTLGLWEAVESRLVLAENARQVLEWVVRGEVDAALVYATDASSMADRVVIGPTAPAGSHAPIVYEGAVLEEARNPGLGLHLLEFLGSDAGREILARKGFGPPPR